MNAERSITTRLPNRYEGSSDAALHFQAIVDECDIDFVEIFKKTPYAAGLKPRGRDAAKDMVEIGGIPLRMKTLRDPGDFGIGRAVGALNVKLTGAGPAEHETKWKARKTNHTSGAPRGGAHESQCYADI